MKTIEELRKDIDECDDELINILGRRLEIAAEISHVKHSKGLQIEDRAREEEVRTRWSREAMKRSMDQEDTLDVVAAILRMTKSRMWQEK